MTFVDIRQAARMFRQSPGFTCTAVLAIALGIGANTAVFSVVNVVLLDPLPYPEPERLVQLVTATRLGTSSVVSVPKFVTWRLYAREFEAIAAYHAGDPGASLTSGDQPEPLRAIHVSSGYFRVFGIQMALGRSFQRSEDSPGGPAVAVISHGFWRRRFGSDAGVIGRTISLNGEPYEVIGIAGPRPVPDPPADVWLPLQASINSMDHTNFVQVAGRLRPGATLRMVQKGMDAALSDFRSRFPRALAPWEEFSALPLREVVVGKTGQALSILLGAVGFVLLIACANVANLLLARAAVRRREVAIRAALGAARWRIVRQLLTESLMLAIVAGAVGYGLGWAGLGALVAASPGNIPRIGDLGASAVLDLRVLLFTIVVSLATGILFGLLPAIHASRADLSAAFKEASTQTGSAPRQRRVQSALVIVEMALALVLLVGSGLLIRTFVALRETPRGFDASNVLTLEMSLAGAKFEKTSAMTELVRDVERRVATISGIQAVATTCSLPLEPSFVVPFTIERRMLFSAPYHGEVNWRGVSPGYFDVFKINLLRGRRFTIHDEAGTLPVAIVNETFARKNWPGGHALGERITLGLDAEGRARGGFAEPPRTIIGVVADVRDLGLDRPLEPIVYVPAAQVSDEVNARNHRIRPVAWVVRTSGDPYTFSAAVQRELRTSTGGLPAGRIRSMQQVVEKSTALADFNMRLFTVFAGIALVLAAVGLYGVMAHSVAERTQEIGIRVALGAAPADVRGMVVGAGLRLTFAGLILGIAVALTLARVMTTFVYGVATWDPLVFTAVAALLSAVALTAAYVPARRATRVDPVIALRA